MDSVVARRAELQKDLDETNSEIRRSRERLDDEVFVAKSKPHVVDEEWALLRQLEDRRTRIEENLRHVEELRPGGLPSPQSGTWSPLALHEWAPADGIHEEPGPSPTANVTHVEDSRRQTSAPEALSKEIAEIIVRAQRPQTSIKQLHRCFKHAGDHLPTLRLLAAAFTGLGATSSAGHVRERIHKLGGTVPELPATIVAEPLQSPPWKATDDLPDARDGLASKERLVLSAMYGLWFRSNEPLKATSGLVDELQLVDSQMTASVVDSTLAGLTHPWSRLNPRRSLSHGVREGAGLSRGRCSQGPAIRTLPVQSGSRGHRCSA